MFRVWVQARDACRCCPGDDEFAGRVVFDPKPIVFFTPLRLSVQTISRKGAKTQSQEASPPLAAAFPIGFFRHSRYVSTTPCLDRLALSDQTSSIRTLLVKVN